MSWRTTPLPKDWPRITKRILERDGHRCTAILSDGTRCTNKATDVHHLGENDDHRDEMLTSACQFHHRRATSAKANACRRRISQKRKPERHPGLIE